MEGPTEASSHRFAILLCVIIVLASIVIKDLQARRSHFAKNYPILFEMVEAAIEECVACGGIGMCLVALRENPVTDVLGRLAELPFVRTDAETVQEQVESIHCLMFTILFYYFALLFFCVLFVTKWSQRGWSADETRAMTYHHPPPDASEYERLRWAFFHPVVRSAGVRRAPDCNKFDAAHLNFNTYMRRVMAQRLCEVINLPKVVILTPLLSFSAFYIIWSVGTQDEIDGSDSRGLYMSAACSWGQLLSAIILRLDIRRLYLRLLPGKAGESAPFVREAYEKRGLQKQGSMYSHQSEAAEADMNTYASLEVVIAREISIGSMDNGGGASMKPNLQRMQLGPKLQDSLFWSLGPVTGPTLLRLWIQATLFGVCILMSVFQQTFSRAAARAHPVVFVLFFLPFPATLACVFFSLKEYAAVTGLEMMADARLISEVIAQTKESRIIPFVGTVTGRHLVRQMRYEAVVEKYRSMDRKAFSELVGSQETQARYEALPELEKRYVEAIFDRHDSDGSRSIDTAELVMCLREQGFSFKTAQRIVADWLHIYDADSSGQLSIEEFQLLHMVLLREVDEVVVCLGDCVTMCKRLDANSDGKMNADEMAKALQEWLDCKINKEDARAIISSISHNANESGQIEMRRVAQWMYKIYQMSVSLLESEAAMMGTLST